VKVHPTGLAGVLLIEPLVQADDRGYLIETWHEVKYREAGIDLPFVQDNQSRSARGVLRGLHYQIERPQGKLVRVVSGEVYDVAVDLRHSSPTFGRWLGVELSEANQYQLWVPPGFAHGFYVLSQSADVIYKCTELYAPEYDRTLRWNDPEIGIAWPLIAGRSPLLSPRDAAAPSFRETRVYD
jgi:dTDP-4-dehydrorhamnose 3,5-epimerase